MMWPTSNGKDDREAVTLGGLSLNHSMVLKVLKVVFYSLPLLGATTNQETDLGPIPQKF